MIEIDFNQKIAEQYVVRQHEKMEYAVGYTIDEMARGVIRYNKNYLLTKRFDFVNNNFKSTVGSNMWQFPRGGRGIRNANQKTNLFYHSNKIDDYFSLHEEGGTMQHDRIEGEVVAWGKNLENWGVEYFRLIGDPKKGEV